MLNNLLIRKNKDLFTVENIVVACEFYDHLFCIAGESELINKLYYNEYPDIYIVEYIEGMLDDLENFGVFTEIYPHPMVDNQEESREPVVNLNLDI